MRTCSNPACKAPFEPKRPSLRHCSTRCRDAQLGPKPRNRLPSHERGYDAEYRRNRPKVLERDGWVCQMPVCKAPTRAIWREAPKGHPLGPSADHIRPVIHGGTSGMDNLRASHRGCNSSAGAAVGNQLRGPHGGVVVSRPRIVRPAPD